MKARIGLEIHVQLTEAGTKLFCGCKSDYRSLPPNTNVCPVCLGLPGALPVPRRRPLTLALAAAIALGCRVPERIVFTRKHYFYPDLPKNYQITQHTSPGGAPICLGGELRYLDPDTWEWRSARISRINLEEDPGRTQYDIGGITLSRYAYVDYNRSGVPLLEVVTEPTISSPREARRVVDALLLILEYIGATNPRLEGAFRVDANISLEGGARVEVKNIGSTLELEKAIRYELLRQSKIMASGGRVARETRHWDPERGVTKALRVKEEEKDYLYFPEPDIPPVDTRDLMGEARILAEESPWKHYEKLLAMGVRREHAWSLIQVKEALEVFERAVAAGGDPGILARLLAVDLRGELKKAGRDPHNPGSWPRPELLAELSRLVLSGRITYDDLKLSIAPRLAKKPDTPLAELLPKARADPAKLAVAAIKASPKAVKDYLAGKKEALEYLVGVALSIAAGYSVDPRLVRREIERILNDRNSDSQRLHGQ